MREHNLLHNQKFLLATLDASADGILISDTSGVVLYVNHAYELTTGLDKSFIVGQSLAFLKEKHAFNESATLQVLATEKPFSLLHRYKTGKSAMTTAIPIFLDGTLAGVFNNTRNITALLKVQKQLAECAVSQDSQQGIKIVEPTELIVDGIVAVSEKMRDALALAITASEYDTTVCIYGETGTGKEVIAKFIHHNSPRRNSPFIKVNCAAIPSELFESELFGYAPGAFTGASDKGKPGLFELANRGTILLDEISELPAVMQSKLLRILQEQELTRVGGTKPTQLDVRVISATNENLEQKVKKGEFRPDLFFRLNVLPITLPPLRSRREDIRPLVSMFLQNLNRKYKKTVAIEEAASDMLYQYNYPGNVRELQNLIEYLFVTALNEWIVVSSLPPKIISDSFSGMMMAGIGGSNLNLLVGAYEKTILEEVLRLYPSITKAAEALGIHASTLCRKIQRYGIQTKHRMEKP